MVVIKRHEIEKFDVNFVHLLSLIFITLFSDYQYSKLWFYEPFLFFVTLIRGVDFFVSLIADYYYEKYFCLSQVIISTISFIFMNSILYFNEDEV